MHIVTCRILIRRGRCRAQSPINNKGIVGMTQLVLNSCSILLGADVFTSGLLVIKAWSISFGVSINLESLNYLQHKQDQSCSTYNKRTSTPGFSALDSISWVASIRCTFVIHFIDYNLNKIISMVNLAGGCGYEREVVQRSFSKGTKCVFEQNKILITTRACMMHTSPGRAWNMVHN